MNLSEKIQAERNRVSEEVQELESQNKKDTELLATLKEEYNRVLFSSNTNDIDFVNSQIKEVMARIGRRKEKINVMRDENNPIIQDLIMGQVTKWFDELKSLEQKAKEKDSKLQGMKKKYVAELLELNNMKNRSARLRSILNHWNDQLSETNRKEIGLSHMDIVSPIVYQIRALMIQDREVFK